MRYEIVLSLVATALAVGALALSAATFVSQNSQSAEDQFPLADREGYVVKLVSQAIRHYEDHGLEATLGYYNSPESVKGSSYVFIASEDGELIAHRDPKVLGLDMYDLVDIAGYRYGEALMEAGEEGAWVDYMHHNRHTGNQEFKHSWVVRYDGLQFGSGWYEILPIQPSTLTESARSPGNP